MADALEDILEELAAREESLIERLSAAVAAGDKEMVFRLASMLVGADRAEIDRQSTSRDEMVKCKRAKK